MNNKIIDLTNHFTTGLTPEQIALCDTFTRAWDECERTSREYQLHPTDENWQAHFEACMYCSECRNAVLGAGVTVEQLHDYKSAEIPF